MYVLCMEHSTFRKGNLSEAKFLADALDKGYKVLIPFGDGSRYDLVLDTGEKLVKVQVKTGRLREGRVIFQTSSNNKGYGRKSYHGEVDYLGVYCPQNDTSYLVPVSLTGSSQMTLRLDPTKNNQSGKVKLAADYEL